jgi:uncharacterized membrane protein YedE/YeeE
MPLDWTHFTPWTALAGGLLIGAAAALLVLLNGRIAGVSSVLGGLIVAGREDAGWRAAFLLGLVAAPALWGLFGELPAARIDASTVTLMVSGLLVGVGTSYGSGCTSGHGVCGLSRLSPRSLVATLAFMLTGAVTVYVARHVLA